MTDCNRFNFRVWHNGRMTYVGSLTFDGTVMTIGKFDTHNPLGRSQPEGFSFAPQAKPVLMQSTGEYDRNGTEIFEGDVVRYRCGGGHDHGAYFASFWVGCICWGYDSHGKPGFVFRAIDGRLINHNDLPFGQLEVMGNLFETCQWPNDWPFIEVPCTFDEFVNHGMWPDG